MVWLLYFCEKKIMTLIMNFIARVGWAFLMGAIIGTERQFRQRNAGLRTNILVSIGAAAFTIFSYSITAMNGGDASRVAAQIVSGIGFLGGGLILKDGVSVRGLNTAATIWCSAACGSLAGIGFYMESAVLVILILITHCVFRPLCRYIERSNSEIYRYSVRVDCLPETADEVRKVITNTLAFNKNVRLQSLFYKENQENIRVVCDLETRGEHKALLDLLLSRLHLVIGVLNVGWERREEVQSDF